MAVFDLYSKRQKRLRGEIPDVFVYDDIPKPLRIQILHIIRDATGENDTYSDEVYEYIHSVIVREYGLFYLGHHNESDRQSITNYFLDIKDIDKSLDIVELFFKYINDIIRNSHDSYSRYAATQISPDEAIAELNQRFKEHGVGYQFDGGEIIRIDSLLLHNEIVKPVLVLLRDEKFKGANEEYLKAHEHYRHGQNKECLAECLKAFESTMKIICKEKNWSFNQTDTAKKLIQICFQNGILPSFTQNQFTSLTSLLESGIPTIRNKLGGHGQGQEPQKVDDEITRYGMNLTGANIIFLVEQSGLG